MKCIILLLLGIAFNNYKLVNMALGHRTLTINCIYCIFKGTCPKSKKNKGKIKQHLVYRAPRFNGLLDIRLQRGDESAH